MGDYSINSDYRNNGNIFGNPHPKCDLCKRQRGNHKAVTLHCPIGRGNFPQFHKENVYTPKDTTHD